MRHYYSAITKILLLSALSSVTASAEISVSPLTYHDGDTALEGSVVADITNKTKRPAVLIFHDWMGPSDETKKQAKKVAELGYVAFVADVYGKGVRPTDAKSASDLSTMYKSDRALMRRRAQAALQAISSHPLVDNQHIAAIGFCFGGTVALELARSGAPTVATVSFHGGLDTPDPALARNIKGKILALHGANDPFVPAKDVQAFEDEMRQAKVDWQLVMYGGAVHGFTNENAGAMHNPGVEYNASATRRSFQAMQQLFNEVFKTL